MADESHGETESRVSVLRRFSTWAWVDTSRPGDDLVGEHEIRLEQRGARDADTLALPAREFVRRPAETVSGSPTRSRTARTRRSASPDRARRDETTAAPTGLPDSYAAG